MTESLWYKDAVIYELHVRAFADSAGDGVGDFRGLTSKLDYLADLGVTALWLLPFYPSPWRDDGYDVADYTDVHPAYGSLRDFRRFLDEAHRRGLRVITELVMNHTSDQHRWFQRARRARPGSRARDFYVWSDTPERYAQARIIFRDFETSNWSWDAAAGAYFWHRFYSHQPDLNFDNPAVHEAILDAMRFWFDLGVDGMRLDAIPYLYEREGTSCDNLPETHAFLKKLRAELDKDFRERMLLAEANLWPEEAASYFGNGDECHMAFHFPVMPRLFMAIQMQDRFPVIDILRQTPEIPAPCQWAIFLRNHDELTLETVTDEERDYMYRMYAADAQARINLGIRRRLAPLLGNDRRKIELMNALLFSLPGTPVLYYGDEIGMGDNIWLGDRNAVRTPMQWSADRNAGFSRANSQRLYLPVIVDPPYDYESVNVEAQEGDPDSLLWWTRRLIALRSRIHAFGRGRIDLLFPDNRKIVAFLRSHEDEHVLVVANLARSVQYTRLDLTAHRGATPVEMFANTPFPRIGEDPYFLTLAPHSFYWFLLEHADARVREQVALAESLVLRMSAGAAVVPHAQRRAWAEALVPLLARWGALRGGQRAVRTARIRDVIRLNGEPPQALLVLLDVEYNDDDPDLFLVPLVARFGTDAAEARARAPERFIAAIDNDGEMGALFDGSRSLSVRRALLDFAASRRRLAGVTGEIVVSAEPELRRLLAETSQLPVAGSPRGRSTAFGNRLILTLRRRVEHEGVDPDVEVVRFLTDHGFPNTPPLLGVIEYRAENRQPLTLALFRGYVPQEGSAWSLVHDAARASFERAGTGLPAPGEAIRAETLLNPPLNVVENDRTLVGAFAELARILGRRVAEMHLALTAEPDHPSFAPEPFTLGHQRSLHQSLRNLAGRVLPLLRARVDSLPHEWQERARALAAAEPLILERFRRVVAPPMDGLRIRGHGDLRLERVLYTGNDFTFVRFGGSPIRALGERRVKRSPLFDVAVLACSFHDAAYTALREYSASVGGHRPTRDWVRAWVRSAAGSAVRAYRERLRGTGLLPSSDESTFALLDALLLEAALARTAEAFTEEPDRQGRALAVLFDLLDEIGSAP